GGLALVVPLPDQPGPALVVGGHAVPAMGTGALRKLLDLLELAVLIGAAIQVPRPVLLAGPDDPQFATVRGRQLDAEMIARPGHFLRLRPLAVRPVALGEQHARLGALVLDPRQVMLVRLVMDPEGGVVVLARR